MTLIDGAKLVRLDDPVRTTISRRVDLT